MALSRKDFVLLASIVKKGVDKHLDPMAMLEMANDIATYCKRENERFDRGRFMAACGFADEGE